MLVAASAAAAPASCSFRIPVICFSVNREKLIICPLIDEFYLNLEEAQSLRSALKAQARQPSAGNER